jgi:hypothetical protein
MSAPSSLFVAIQRKLIRFIGRARLLPSKPLLLQRHWLTPTASPVPIESCSGSSAPNREQFPRYNPTPDRFLR